MRISDWSSDVCSSDLPPQDIVLPEEVVQQGNAAMADDQDEQRPGDRRMETAQTGHPRNPAALGDQLDTESRPAMTAAQHGEAAGDRHQRHAHIAEGMDDPDQDRKSTRLNTNH